MFRSRSVYVAVAAVGVVVALAAVSCSSSEDSASTTSAPTTSSTAPSKDATLTVKSASYDKTFTVESCTDGTEDDLVVNAKDGDLTATVTAWGGSGALKVDGGSEGDGVTLNGVLDSVEIGDAGDVAGSGTFGEPNFKGETFTISGSCAGAESATTTTTPGSKDVAKAAKADLEVWQRDLNTVGCFAGAVDGTSGPQTVSAVRAFQAASGLTPDGVLGPKTESALQDAAAAKRVVCASPTDGGAAATKARLVLSAPSFNKTFLVGTCKSGGETSVQLVGQADGLTVKLSANNGTGTISVDGSTETDGITLKGNVSSVTVGDTGDVTVKGTFTAPNFAGEQFTATGSCA